MLSGEVNENGKKNNNNNNNRSNYQKSDFARAAHFFIVHFFAVVLHDVRLQREISRNFPVFKDGNKFQAFKSQTENFTF